MSLHASGASVRVSTEKPDGKGPRPRSARIRAFCAALLLLGVTATGGFASSASSASPTTESVIEARARSGAWADPGAAWHHVLIAREAPRDAAGMESAIEHYRLAVELDPDLLDGWIGLASRGFPTNLPLVSEGIVGAVGAASGSWEARRRLDAAIFPTLWLATLLAASALLLGIGLRHIRPYHHRLQEGLRMHFGRRRAGWVATFLCLTPFAILGGIASAGAVYAGLVHHELTRRERGALLLALLWFCLMPTVWRDLSERARPIQTDETAWIIDRAQREVPTPALEQTIRQVASTRPSAEAIFARGMMERRKGMFPEALTDFQRAASEVSAVSAHAGVDAGNVRLWMNKPEEAAQTYERMLDFPDARLEARYNLAIALSRLRRFEEADQRLEEAQMLDLDRVRSASRNGDPRATADVMDGVLSPSELQSVARASEGVSPAPVPPATSIFLPGGRPSAAVLMVIVSIVLSAAVGSLMRKRLAIHACHQCGAPVCRHCVTRTIGRASCPRCAESNGSVREIEYSRILLHRALGRRKDPGERARAIATYLFPGIGLIVRGHTWAGLILSWLFAFGTIFATRAAWAFPVSVAIESLEAFLRIAGVVLSLLAWSLSCAVARRAIRRRSLRRFFERDAYRMAA